MMDQIDTSTKNLTAQQELFLEYLFNDDECNGNTLAAARKAGFTDSYHPALARGMKDEILKRSQERMALMAPRAVIGLEKLLDEDGSTPKADIRLKAVENVLDRVGVAKKQQVDIAMDNSSPLFFISAKTPVNLTED